MLLGWGVGKDLPDGRGVSEWGVYECMPLHTSEM